MGDNPQTMSQEILKEIQRLCNQLEETDHEYLLLLSNPKKSWQIGSNKGRQFLDANKGMADRFFDLCYNATAKSDVEEAESRDDLPEPCVSKTAAMEAVGLTGKDGLMQSSGEKVKNISNDKEWVCKNTDGNSGKVNNNGVEKTVRKSARIELSKVKAGIRSADTKDKNSAVVTGRTTRKRSLSLPDGEQSSPEKQKKIKSVDVNCVKNSKKTPTRTDKGSKHGTLEKDSVESVEIEEQSETKNQKCSTGLRRSKRRSCRSRKYASDEYESEDSETKDDEYFPEKEENSNVIEVKKESSDGDKEWWVCKICDRSFTVEHHIKRHLVIHSKEKDFVCSFCDKRYLFKAALQEHVILCKKNPNRLKVGKDVSQNQKKTMVRLEGNSILVIVPSTTEAGTYTNISQEEWELREPDVEKREKLLSTYKQMFKDRIDAYYKSHLNQVQHFTTNREKQRGKVVPPKNFKRYAELRNSDAVVNDLDPNWEERNFSGGCISAETRQWYKEFYLDNSARKGDKKGKDFLDFDGVNATCKICGLVFVNISKLRNHVVIHTGIKAFRCAFCSRKFFYIDGLRQHAVICKKNPERLLNPTCKQVSKAAREVIIISSPDEQYMYTNLATNSRVSGQRVSTQHSVLMKSSDVSELKKKALIESRSKALKIMKSSQIEKDLPFKCKFCDDGFTSFQDLKSHHVNHTEIKRLICYFCPQSFYFIDDLQNHVMQHFQHSLADRENRDIETGNTETDTGSDLPVLNMEEDSADSDLEGNSADSDLEGTNQIAENNKEDKLKSTDVQKSDMNNTGSVTASQKNCTEENIRPKSDVIRISEMDKDESANVDLNNSDPNHVVGAVTSVKRDMCEACGVMFNNVRELRQHRKQHKIQNSGKRVCMFCNRIFNHEDYLVAHLYTCKRKASLRETLIKGLPEERASSSNQNIEPEITTEKSHSNKTDDKATVFLPTAGNDKPVIDKPVSDKPVNDKPVKSKVSETAATDREVFKCKKCPSDFSDVKNLVWHELSCHGKDSISKCPLCKENIEVGTLYDHMRGEDLFSIDDVQYTPPVPTGPGTVYECSKCVESFQALDKLWIHQIEHVEGQAGGQNKDLEPYPCDKCGKMFVSIYSYRRHHESVHVGKRNFVCEQCGKAFKTKDGMRTHGVVHTKDYCPYTCEVCGKKFLKPSLLEKHMPLHTGVRAFMCEDCGKTFLQKQNLVKHRMLRHSDVKRYKCELCEMAYKTQDKLKNHMKAHVIKDGIANTYGKLHVCDVCNKKCVDLQQLRQHMTSHSEERPYECNQCGRRYKQKCKLTRHLKSSPKNHTYTNNNRQKPSNKKSAESQTNAITVKIEPSEVEYEINLSQETGDTGESNQHQLHVKGVNEADEVIQQVTILESGNVATGQEIITSDQYENIIVIPQEYLGENAELIMTDEDDLNVEGMFKIVVMDSSATNVI